MNIGLGNGFAHNMCQAITWLKHDSGHIWLAKPQRVQWSIKIVIKLNADRNSNAIYAK